MPKRCNRCKRFISREGKSLYCDDCYFWYYSQVGKLPDNQIPRSIRIEHARQKAKIQEAVRIDAEWQQKKELGQ